MKALLITLALLALAVSAASTLTSGGCGYQTPHPPQPPITLLSPIMPQPPHPCPCQQPTYPSPCQHPGHCVGTPPLMLGQCIEFLRQQCSPTATPYCSPQCNALRQQCCQQLRHVEPLHLYQAIFSTILQQQPQSHPLAMLIAAQVAQQLMQMCGLQQPSPCPSCSAPAGVIHH